jgi:ATP-dependent DNA helicase RecG
MIRELLINAVAHTDYSKAGETIKAFVYDDRIEIHNPGPMLPGTTTDDIRERRSKIRNRGIAGVLRRIRYMERFGTAWETIGQEVGRGYPEPLLDGDGAVFTAMLWRYSSFAGSSIPPSRQSGGISGGINQEVSGLGTGELQDRLIVPARTLERDLAALREAGLVIREGSRKTGLYRPVKME